jgi:hypothetical protein
MKEKEEQRRLEAERAREAARRHEEMKKSFLDIDRGRSTLDTRGALPSDAAIASLEAKPIALRQLCDGSGAAEIRHPPPIVAISSQRARNVDWGKVMSDGAIEAAEIGAAASNIKPLQLIVAGAKVGFAAVDAGREVAGRDEEKSLAVATAVKEWQERRITTLKTALAEGRISKEEYAAGLEETKRNAEALRRTAGTPLVAHSWVDVARRAVTSEGGGQDSGRGRGPRLRDRRDALPGRDRSPSLLATPGNGFAAGRRDEGGRSGSPRQDAGQDLPHRARSLEPRTHDGRCPDRSGRRKRSGCSGRRGFPLAR